MNATRDEYSEYTDPVGGTPQQADEPSASSAGLTHNKSETVSPGELLREGRLTHDYSVDDLCVQTKLARHIVEALEDNDFPALPEPVFTRGYYRRCAAVLDLDEARLLAAYKAWGGETEAAPRLDRSIPVSGVVPRDITPGRRSRFRGAFLFLILAIIVVIVAMFLLSKDGPLSKFMSGSETSGSQAISITQDFNDAGDASNVATPPSQDAGTPPDTGASSLDTQTTDGGQATQAGAGDQPAAGVATGPADVATQNQTTGPKPGGRNLTQEFGITPSTTAAVGETAGQEGESQEPVKPAVPPNRLVLTFTKRSWIKVTDANGNRLAQGNYDAGETKEFNGKPPYNVTLGFAPGVKATIGGQPVDIAAQSGGSSVAHLTIQTAGQ